MWLINVLKLLMCVIILFVIVSHSRKCSRKRAIDLCLQQSDGTQTVSALQFTEASLESFANSRNRMKVSDMWGGIWYQILGPHTEQTRFPNRVRVLMPKAALDR